MLESQQNKELCIFLSQILLKDQSYLEQINYVASQFTSDSEKSFSVESFSQFLSENAIEKFKDFKKVKRLYLDGCFDLMHSGHFNAIRQAKQLCEQLVVGVIKTSAIEARKGTPVLSFSERMGIAKACKWIDEVTVAETYDPQMSDLEKNNCSHLCHGDDLITNEKGENAYKEFIDQNKMLLIKRTEGISTTDIVGRLLLMTKSQQNQKEYSQQRKLSGDTGTKASQLEERKIEQTSSVDNVQNRLKLLNTTKRIRQFSEGNKQPGEKDTIIYIDGCFDILHIGLIELLEKAKNICENTFLIVGIYDDEVINNLKGMNYPILTLQERVLNLLALKYVDEVIIGAPNMISQQMIGQFHIQKVVFGDTEDLDNYKVPKQMNIFTKVELENRLDNKGLIKRIVENREKIEKIYETKIRKQDKFYSDYDRKQEEL